MASFLGPALSIGAGLLGGSGKSSSSTTKQELDPRMAPFIFGDPASGQTGLLNYGQQKLDQQMQPGAMPGFGQMQNRGMELMGGSVAGNPFSGGYKGGLHIPQPMTNGMGRYTPPPMQAPAPAQQQAPQWSINEIMAELERRRLASLQAGPYGGEAADGFGNNNGGYDGEGNPGGGFSA